MPRITGTHRVTQHRSAVRGVEAMTFTAMIAGVSESAVADGLATAGEFDAGIAALRRTATTDGSFATHFSRPLA